MKFSIILALVLASVDAHRHHHHHHHRHQQHSLHQHKAIPDNEGDKNPDTPEKTWAEYQANRPNEHDCHINESKNWFGNHKCKFSWECKGASVCETNKHGGSDIGWCRGPDACPLIGPLDTYKEDQSNVTAGIKLNPGSQNRRDLNEGEENFNR